VFYTGILKELEQIGFSNVRFCVWNMIHVFKTHEFVWAKIFLFHAQQVDCVTEDFRNIVIVHTDEVDRAHKISMRILKNYPNNQSLSIEVQLPIPKEDLQWPKVCCFVNYFSDDHCSIFFSIL